MFQFIKSLVIIVFNLIDESRLTFAQKSIQITHHLHVRRHLVPRLFIRFDGTERLHHLLLLVGKKSEIVPIVIQELTHLLIARELVVMEGVDTLAAVEKLARLISGIDDGLKELQVVTHSEPTLHHFDSLVDGMDERTSTQLTRKATITFQERIELTVVCFLAVAEQLSTVIAALHRHHVEDVLPCFNEVIQHLLRNSLCLLYRKLAGITHDVASRFLTAHIWIVIVIESIQMAAHQLIEEVDGGIV